MFFPKIVFFSQKHVACLSIHIPWYLCVLVLPPNCCCILYTPLSLWPKSPSQGCSLIVLKWRMSPVAIICCWVSFSTSPETENQSLPWPHLLGPLGTPKGAPWDPPARNPCLPKRRVRCFRPDMAWRRKKHGTSHETKKMPLSLISFMLVGYLKLKLQMNITMVINPISWGIPPLTMATSAYNLHLHIQVIVVTIGKPTKTGCTLYCVYV